MTSRRVRVAYCRAALTALLAIGSSAHAAGANPEPRLSTLTDERQLEFTKAELEERKGTLVRAIRGSERSPLEALFPVETASPLEYAVLVHLKAGSHVSVHRLGMSPVEPNAPRAADLRLVVPDAVSEALLFRLSLSPVRLSRRSLLVDVHYRALRGSSVAPTLEGSHLVSLPSVGRTLVVQTSDVSVELEVLEVPPAP